jgi:hypothetical protein
MPEFFDKLDDAKIKTHDEGKFTITVPIRNVDPTQKLPVERLGNMLAGDGTEYKIFQLLPDGSPIVMVGNNRYLIRMKELVDEIIAYHEHK